MKNYGTNECLYKFEFRHCSYALREKANIIQTVIDSNIEHETIIDYEYNKLFFLISIQIES